MSKRLVRSFTFDPANRKITVLGNRVLFDFLLITNVTDNVIIYNFADPSKGATAIEYADNNTTITLAYDTTSMSSTDILQIYIDSDATRIEAQEALTDPVERMRVANPQALIDTDFEYSLQPTKWETIQTQNNIPSVYQKANEPAFTAEQITSITSAIVESTPSSASITYDTTLESIQYNQDDVPNGTGQVDSWIAVTLALNSASNAGNVQVVGVVESSGNVNSLDLPAGVQANDVVLYLSGEDGGGPPNVPTGYTTGGQINQAVDLTWAYRVMPATPDTQITGLDNATDVAIVAIVLRNIDVADIVEAVNDASSNANQVANPPAITPINDNCAIFTLIANDDDQIAATVTPPVNFDLVASAQAAQTGCTVSIGFYQQGTAQAINPGVQGNRDTSGISANVSLPWTNTISGFNYSVVNFNSEGVMFFGGAGATTSTNNLTLATYTNARHLKIFAQDMALIKVGSATRGTAPSREFIVKYECTNEAIGSTKDLTNVAYIVFFEDSSDIELHYYKNASTGTAHLSNGTSVQVSWTPTTNATGGTIPVNDGYIVQDATRLSLDVVSRELIRVEVNTPPEETFAVGQPITIKETKDTVYLDGSSIIVQVDNTDPNNPIFYLPNLSPVSYGSNNQANDFTVIYTGGFYFTAEIPFSTVESINASKQVRITFSSPPSLFLGSTIFVVDPVSSDTDWIGAFTINKVLSDTEFEYLALRGTNFTSTATLSSGSTRIYTSNQGAAQHRYFDGGIQISPETSAPNAKMIRQTKSYFRYQSGKGIQFSTGVLFKPTYDVASVSVNDNNIVFDPEATEAGDGFYTVTIETEQYHGFALPDAYREGALLNFYGFTVTSGANPYNGQYRVKNVISPKIFQIDVPVSQLDFTTDLDPGGIAKVELVKWNDATVRSGLFDDQNGLFFEYDGNELYCVRRNSTQQLSGLVSIAKDSATLTGTNTKFKTQLAPNDYVVIKGTTYIVTDIASDTSLTIAPDYKGPTSTDIKIVRVTDLRTPRTEFTFDKLDGTGPSGYIFDANKMQMVFIDYSWYGAGRVRYGMRGLDGRVFYFHEYLNNNINTEAYMRSGNLPGRFEISTESVNGQLPVALADTDTTTQILTSDANRLPDKGRIIIANEYIEYTKAGTSGDNTILNLDNRNVGFLTSGPVSAVVNTGWLSYNQNCAPVLSHWGVSVLMDGNFDEDKSYLFTASTSDTKSVAAGAELALLTVRLAPSVDYGIPAFFGVRNLINRSQLILKNLGIIADGQFVVTARINAKSSYFETESNWTPAGNGSLAQYVDHSLDVADTAVTDGDIVAQFLTDEGSNRLAASYYDIQDIRPLANSILGGPNVFPDGPDTLVIFAKNNGGVAANIGCSLNWTESQG